MMKQSIFRCVRANDGLSMYGYNIRDAAGIFKLVLLDFLTSGNAASPRQVVAFESSQMVSAEFVKQSNSKSKSRSATLQSRSARAGLESKSTTIPPSRALQTGR